MQKIAQGNRGEVFLTEKDGKKIIIKKALDETKKGAIKKEIQILQKIKSLGINFVPEITEFGEDYFSEIYIEGTRFDRTIDKLDKNGQTKLIKKLLKNLYILDKKGIIHGEVLRPYNNILVDKQNNVHIIDFERGAFGDFSGKNLRSFSQRLLSKGYLDIDTVRQLGQLKTPEEIYKHILKNMKKTSFDLSYLYIIGLILLDQISKYLIYNQKLIGGYFISPVFNTGISWSIKINYIFVYIISVLALFLVAYFYQKKSIGKYAFILFVAGLFGNLIDRVFLGGVRDFIDFHFFPVFNFADVFLSCAVILILIKELKK